MIYADTSALAKLIVVEPETSALRTWLRSTLDHDDVLLTNSIGSVELRRLAARLGAEFSVIATRLLGRVGMIELTPQTIDLAARLPPPVLRTLDALHIASASMLGELTALVTYDVRMLQAADQWGLPTAAPGLTAPSPSDTAE